MENRTFGLLVKFSRRVINRQTSLEDEMYLDCTDTQCKETLVVNRSWKHG